MERRDKIRGHLYSLLTVSAGPVIICGLMLVTLSMIRSTEDQLAKQRLITTAHLISRVHDQAIDGGEDLLKTVSRFSTVQRQDRDGCRELFAEILQRIDGYESLVLIGPDGELVAASGPVAEPVNFSQQPYFKKALAQRGFATGDYIVGLVSGQPVLPMVYPFYDAAGKLKGLVAGEKSTVWLTNLFHEQRLPPGLEIALLDRQGRLFAQFPDDFGDESPALRKPLVEDLTEAYEQTSETVTKRLEREYVVFTVLGDSTEDVFLLIRQPNENLIPKIMHTYRIWIVFVFLLSMGLTFILWLSLIFRPLLLLVENLNCLGAGDFSARVGPLHAVIELVQIGQRIDSLAEKLQKREQELHRNVKELERSNRDLEQFAYVASHDLQEPLRVIASYVKLLKRRYGDRLDDDAGEFFDFITSAVDRMRTLINDLLGYSRLRTRGQPMQPVDLNAVFGETLSNLEHSIRETDARITHDSLPTVVGDRTQLVQLFQNLLSNSIKFCGDKVPEIYVGAEERESEYLLWVQDNGIGIDPKYSEKIFRIFERLHGQGTVDGTGIGLAACRRIVERHGGWICVESREGEGAVFYFTLKKDGVSRGGTPESLDAEQKGRG